MTVKELAKKCGCSASWIYHIAKELNRMPTEQDIKSRKGKSGRPRKYK